MNSLLKVENAAQFALVLVAICLQPIALAWWIWPLIFLAPDLSMAGYLAGSKAGAWSYNLFHHKAVAVGVIIAGYFLHAPWAYLTGLALYGHSALDRMLGYGLKYGDRFTHTHLGWIGKDRDRDGAQEPNPRQTIGKRDNSGRM